MAYTLNANARAVLDSVQASSSHPTAQEVYEAVRQARPRIGLATVYRILHQLVEQGALKMWEYGSTCTRYDANIERHDHALCTTCGALLDVPVEIALPREVLERAAQASGIELGSHEIRIYGRCQSCQARSKI